MTGDIDVVIVGAGAAGIAAARRLAGSDRSVLMLEATRLIGGRARTQVVSGVPLDLGCGWLHSADRNPWAPVAEEMGVAIDRRPGAYGVQWQGRGFSPADQMAAKAALADWNARLAGVASSSDRASNALDPDCRWNDYIRAMAGYGSGARLEDMSATDYLAYDAASTGLNWRAPGGYGALIAASLPHATNVHRGVPVRSVALDGAGVVLETPQGPVRGRTAILTLSTAMLGSDRLGLPAAFDPWRDAAAALPLGRDEKLFLEMVDPGAFEMETHLLGVPTRPMAGGYYIGPLGRPVIEVFFGGEGAQTLRADGAVAAYARAVDELADLLGSGIRRAVRPMALSNWGESPFVGGAYSYARPGHAAARQRLALPYGDRVFFAGEATHRSDFSTAHGAFHSGVRAAEEALTALGARR